MSTEPPTAQEAKPPTDSERALKIRDKGARWSVHPMWLATVSRSDGRQLVVTVQFDEHNQEYLGACVETDSDAESLDEVFEDHAHAGLGPYKSELEIKDECSKYIADWLEAGPPLTDCDCEPIHH